MSAVRGELGACKKLVEFIRVFSELQEKQLDAIRADLAKIVEQVMDGVHHVSQKTEQKKRQADEVYIKDGEDSFKKGSMSELERQQEGECAHAAMKRKLMRMGGKFTKQLEAMSTLESEMHDLLFTMMGALSGDDVIRQRLDHVIMGLHSVNIALADIIAKPERNLNVAEVERIKAMALTEIYKSYTTEEEKKVFHEIFGRPVAKKRAS